MENFASHSFTHLKVFTEHFQGVGTMFGSGDQVLDQRPWHHEAYSLAGKVVTLNIEIQSSVTTVG